MTIGDPIDWSDAVGVRAKADPDGDGHDVFFAYLRIAANRGLVSALPLPDWRGYLMHGFDLRLHLDIVREIEK